MGQVVLYAFDTMADWEYAYVTTVLQMAARGGDDRYRLVVAGAAGEPVTTLGGLRVLPETTLGDLDESDIAGPRRSSRHRHLVCPVQGRAGRAVRRVRKQLFGSAT